MLDWDVLVSVSIEEDYAEVSFILWGIKLEGCFYLDGDKWNNNHDCPHYITGNTSVWQWIAMELHKKLTP